MEKEINKMAPRGRLGENERFAEEEIRRGAEVILMLYDWSLEYEEEQRIKLKNGNDTPKCTSAERLLT